MRTPVGAGRLWGTSVVVVRATGARERVWDGESEMERRSGREMAEHEARSQ